MEDKITQLKNLKTISLSTDERNQLRARLTHTVATYVPPRIPSFIQHGAIHGLRIALSTFLFVVFVGSSVSVVANSALPGDPLYAFKLNVNEEIKGAFLKTTEEKVAWQKGRIETRADEIQTLAETKTLTKARQERVQQALDTHVAALSRELTTLSAETPTIALSVTASLEESLKTTKEVIESTGKTQAESVQALMAVNNALQKVSEEEVKIIAKEIDNIAADIDATDPTLTALTIETNTATTTSTQTPDTAAAAKVMTTTTLTTPDAP